MEKKLNKKNKWKELFDKSKKIEVTIADLSIVNHESFKMLRNKLQLTQSKFAHILGVTKKDFRKMGTRIKSNKRNSKNACLFNYGRS